MSNQPPNDQFDSDLQSIENAMNSMMQGAFSMLFKQLVDTTFENPTTTTIVDGKNISSNTMVEDEFGGNDFKRLRTKSKQNRGLIATEDKEIENKMQTNNRNAAGPILNLLFHNEEEQQAPKDDKVTYFPYIIIQLFNLEICRAVGPLLVHLKKQFTSQMVLKK